MVCHAWSLLLLLAYSVAAMLAAGAPSTHAMDVRSEQSGLQFQEHQPYQRCREECQSRDDILRQCLQRTYAAQREDPPGEESHLKCMCTPRYLAAHVECVRCDPEPYRSAKCSDKQNVEESLAECRKAGHDIDEVDLSGLTTETSQPLHYSLQYPEPNTPHLPGFAIASAAAWGGSVRSLAPSVMEATLAMAREQYPDLMQACRDTCIPHRSLGPDS